jgi:hypothetical protein
MGRPKGSYNKAKVVKKAGGQTTETWATFGKLTAKVILAAIRHNPDSAGAEDPVVWIPFRLGSPGARARKR